MITYAILGAPSYNYKYHGPQHLVLIMQAPILAVAEHYKGSLRGYFTGYYGGFLSRLV